ncbi:MAG TPA: hypothetical protein VFO48_00555 [Vicinamibacterales bacterium]|nr:hypothetical protein [Vicinamibacterales bacterium]
MRSTTLVTTLTSLTTAMAVAAPIVLFGFLYVLKVQPERAAALEARQHLAAAQAELNRQRVFAAAPPVVPQVSALDELDARTAGRDSVGDVVDTLTALLSSPAVGAVSNLSIETDHPIDGPGDSFARKVVHTPVIMTFDARYEQIGRFFWNLRTLPTIVDLQSVELTPGVESRGGVMRAKVSLHVFHRPGVAAPRERTPQAVDVVTAPRWNRDPFVSKPQPAQEAAAAPPPAPVVHSILFSSGRRVAQVDGRIVRAGDRVGNSIVQSIERDAVIMADASGATRRIAIERPVIRVARR